jgi:hypothetical protein
MAVDSGRHTCERPLPDRPLYPMRGRARRAWRTLPPGASRFPKTRCTSRAPSLPSTPVSTSGSLSPAASALPRIEAVQHLGVLWLPVCAPGTVPVIVDPRKYCLNRGLSVSRSPPQLAVECVDDLPRRQQAGPLEVPNNSGTQPHLLDRTKRVAGFAQQGIVTRVIKGFIFEMAIVQRFADPPRQRMDRFRLGGPGVTPHVSARPHREPGKDCFNPRSSTGSGPIPA